MSKHDPNKRFRVVINAVGECVYFSRRHEAIKYCIQNHIDTRNITDMWAPTNTGSKA